MCIVQCITGHRVKRQNVYSPNIVLFMKYINEVLHLLISNSFFQRRILLKYYLFQNKLTESVRMPPEWSSGFEVKLEKSETPSIESQDEVKLEQDDD